MVDFTRFMGRGNLEPRFAPMPIATPAPTPVAPPPAPLPSVEPAPMPAPVAPLPTPIPSFAPDPMNIPGLPQLPMPAPVPPVAQPAPVPAPVPLPQVEPMPPVKPLPTTPPIMELPNVPPFPVTPPPMVEPVPTPVPAPTPITPPPTPPTPVAPPPAVPPFEVAPGPVPTPVTPPPLPPREPPIPPMEVAPGPVPTPVTPPPLPPSMVLPPELQDALTGIETLAPDDFTAPVEEAPQGRVADVIPLPDGSNFNVNEIQPNFDAGLTMGDILLTQPGEIKLPEGVSDTVYAGGSPNFDETTGQYRDIPGADFTFGGFDPNQFNFNPDDIPEEFSLGYGTPNANTRYQAGARYFDNIEEARAFANAAFGNIDGVTAYVPEQDPTTGSGTDGAASGDTGQAPAYANQDWYQNMTDEQRAAYDEFIANGGLNNITGYNPFSGGSFNINVPGMPGYVPPGETTYTVNPVESNFEFTAGTPAGSGQNVSVATEYALPGTVAPRAPADNPFVRPETQQGIGSLAGGG